MAEQDEIHELIFSLRKILSSDTTSPTIETSFKGDVFIVNIDGFILLQYSKAKYGNEANAVIENAINDIKTKIEEIKSILYK